MNYDKRKFGNYIEKNLKFIEADSSLLDENKVTQLINAAKPNQKELINFTKQTINQEDFTKEKEKINEILTASVINKTIERLIEHNDIRSWVETGLKLHEYHNYKSV